MTNAQEIEKRREVQVYPKRGIVVEKANGWKVWDSQEREYIDCGANYGVCNAGHCNTQIVKAIQKQAEKIIYIQATFTNPVRSELMERLCELTGLDRVFLCNSGTEAVEAAIKFARASTGRKKIVAAMMGFHGRTMGALSATYKAKYREPFVPLVPGFSHVPYNDVEKLKEAVTDETAAIILEPIQGEGGIRVASKEYLQEARKICDSNGTLLILDEVQTGLCRTGRFFAFQHFGIEADILCLAKSLGNGYPIGAVVCKEKAAHLPIMSHGATFGGSPLACAAALATLDYMQENKLDEEAKEKGEYFMGLLKEIKNNKIRDVRGMGLMIGVELKERAGPYLKALLEKGVLALPAGPNVIRFLPPLIISKEDLKKVVNILGEVLG